MLCTSTLVVSLNVRVGVYVCVFVFYVYACVLCVSVPASLFPHSHIFHPLFYRNYSIFFHTLSQLQIMDKYGCQKNDETERSFWQRVIHCGAARASVIGGHSREGHLVQETLRSKFCPGSSGNKEEHISHVTGPTMEYISARNTCATHTGNCPHAVEDF